MKLLRHVFVIMLFVLGTHHADAQTVMDFRAAAAKVFPATVAVEADLDDKSASNKRRLGEQREQMRSGMRAGQGMPVPFVYRMKSMLPLPSSSLAGFAIAPDLVIIAGTGETGDSVELGAAGDRHIAGKIIVSDFAIGLAAVRLDESVLDPLSWHQETLKPGQPLLTARIDESGAPIAAGSMITTSAIASHPELGMIHRLSIDAASAASGSPLVDENGNLVGALMIVGGREVCLPVASIMRLIETAQSDSPIDLWPGRIGVALMDRGDAIVSKVQPDSPAAKIELKSGDRIISVGGVSTNNTNELMATVAMRRGGDTVALVIDRDGEQLSFDVVLDSDKSKPQRDRMSGPQPIQAPMWRLEDGKLLPFGGEFKLNEQAAENMRKTIENAMPQGDRMLIDPPQLRGIQVERSVLENTIRDLESKLDTMRREQTELQEKIRSMSRVSPNEWHSKPSAEKLERLMDQMKQEIEMLKKDRQ